VLAGAGVTTFVLLSKDKGTPNGTPTTSVTTPAGVETLQLPDSLAGFTKSNEAGLQSLVDGLIQEMKASIPAATGVGAAVYGDPAAATKFTIVVQIKSNLDLGSAALDGMFVGLGSSGFSVTGEQSVPAPSGLSGDGKCGSSEVQGIALTVCGWAANRSLGMAVFYFRTVDESIPIVNKIRTGLGF
jgi:hypothetical protein